LTYYHEDFWYKASSKLVTTRTFSSDTTLRSFERRSLGRYNTNETWAWLTYKGLTPLITQNLKTMGLWVFILIWCSTFSFLLNVGRRLTLGFPTIITAFDFCINNILIALKFATLSVTTCTSFPLQNIWQHHPTSYTHSIYIFSPKSYKIECLFCLSTQHIYIIVNEFIFNHPCT